MIILCNALALSALLLTSASNNGRETFTRTDRESYEVSGMPSVRLDNRYGSIRIYSWDRPTVKLEVLTEVKAQTSRKAEELFKAIQIAFSREGQTISASTRLDFTKERGGTIFRLDEFISSLLPGRFSNEFKIKYSVWLPRESDLEVVMKYGQIDADALDGPTKIDLKYGELTLQDVRAKTTLNLAYGKATCNSLQHLKADLRYSKVKTGAIRSGNIRSRYTGLDLAKADSLLIDSGYDTYRMGEVEYLDIMANYGTVIASLAANAEKVKLDASYTGVTLKLPHNNAFTCYAEGKYSSFRLPPDTRFTIDRGESSYRELKGQYRSGRGFFLEADLRYSKLQVDKSE